MLYPQHGTCINYSAYPFKIIEVLTTMHEYSTELSTGTIPLKRVKYSSKQETDAINNFKILQSAFKKLNVDQV